MKKMEKQKIAELTKWLKEQIKAANKIIEEAHQRNNYGKEAQYLGMREAFMRILHKMPDSVE